MKRTKDVVSNRRSRCAIKQPLSERYNGVWASSFLNLIYLIRSVKNEDSNHVVLKIRIANNSQVTYC